MIKLMTTLKVKISGMHCESCAQVITLDLEALAGVKSAKVNQASGLAAVEFDEKITDQQAILETIKNSGYQGELTHE